MTIIVLTTVISIIFNGITNGEFLLFIAIWVFIFIPLGSFFAFGFFWNIFGKERIIFKQNSLLVKRKILGIGSQKEYLISELKNLRIANQRPYFSFKYFLEILGYSGGVLAFDYGMKTVKFANSIEEAEGNHLIKEISAWIRKAE